MSSINPTDVGVVTGALPASRKIHVAGDRHCGLRVAAISAITNLAVGLGDTPLSHAQTLEVARQCAGDMERLLAAFFGRFAHGN